LIAHANCSEFAGWLGPAIKRRTESRLGFRRPTTVDREIHDYISSKLRAQRAQGERSHLDDLPSNIYIIICVIVEELSPYHVEGLVQLTTLKGRRDTFYI